MWGIVDLGGIFTLCVVELSDFGRRFAPGKSLGCLTLASMMAFSLIEVEDFSRAFFCYFLGLERNFPDLCSGFICFWVGVSAWREF